MSFSVSNRYVSNIKCFGELSRQRSDNCWTHKELTKLAKERNLPSGGTKKELAERLGIRYINFRKYSDVYSIFGYYNYNTIHMGRYIRYVDGREEKTKESYTDRIVGLMMEKLITLSSKKDVFDVKKALSLLKISEKELISKNVYYFNENVVLDDVIKIFDKYEIEYLHQDIQILGKILKLIASTQNDKKKSTEFRILTNSMGGAIEYLFPDFFNEIKFIEIQPKGEILRIISPFFGVYENTGPKKCVKIARLNQLTLIGLPLISLDINSTSILNDKNFQPDLGLPIRYVYLSDTKIKLNCDYGGLFHTGPAENYAFIVEKNTDTNIRFIINNNQYIIFNISPQIPPLPEPIKNMSLGSINEFLRENKISEDTIRAAFNIKGKKKLTRRDYILNLSEHPIVGDISPIKAIIEYERRSGRKAVTKEDIERSIKKSQLYYNEIFRNDEYEVNIKALKKLMDDKLVNNIKLPKIKNDIRSISGSQWFKYKSIAEKKGKKKKERKI